MYYRSNLESLVQLEEIGDLNTYHLSDRYDRFAGLEASLDHLTETGMTLPGNTDDVNYMGYLESQFNWGKTQVSFWRHPSEDNKAYMSTKNILGR